MINKVSQKITGDAMRSLWLRLSISKIKLKLLFPIPLSLVSQKKLNNDNL